MDKKIYEFEEFAKRAKISHDDLASWEKLGLLKPLGFIDGKTPYYCEEHLQQVSQIKRLREIGYLPEDIRKILKKVGLPKIENLTSINNKEEYITVGELAAQAGLNSRTIKYWEERGIIEPDRRTAGGFRLYPKIYVYLCLLIKDLQNFGYVLEEIKKISDLFRDFIAIQSDKEKKQDAKITIAQLETMETFINSLQERMDSLREGIERWEGLLKKKRKEISQLKIDTQLRMPK